MTGRNRGPQSPDRIKAPPQNHSPLNRGLISFLSCCKHPLLVIGTSLGMFIRIDGKPQVCMLVSIISCALNAVLDYIWVGRLSMGVQGSSIASLAVQVDWCDDSGHHLDLGNGNLVEIQVINLTRY